MPTQWESIANEHILGIAPYEPGKPIEELERELMIHNPIKLASNENPLPPSDRVQKAIIAALSSLNRYPDGSGFYLRQALAKKHGVMPDQIVLGNGSNELIELLVRTFLRPGDEAVVPASVVRRVPDDRPGRRRRPRDGHAEGLPAGPRGDGAGAHADDEDRLRGEPEQPDGHHRHQGRGRALHGPRAGAHDRRVRRGVHRVRDGPGLPGHDRRR